jgi:hypothetical protein
MTRSRRDPIWHWSWSGAATPAGHRPQKTSLNWLVQTPCAGFLFRSYSRPEVAAHLRPVRRPHPKRGFPKICDRMQLLRYPLRERRTFRSSPYRPCCHWPTGSVEDDHLQESTHASPPRRSSPPPRRVTNPGLPTSDPIWGTLTANQRQLLLHALSRLLVRRLPASDGKEVRDDQS